MKVICAGFWKTGTKSLANALEKLGYKVYDYDDQLFNLGHLWEKFFDGTVTDEEIRKNLENVDVLIDGPVIAFWEEILRVFPDAKVILSIRSEDEWFKSYEGMVNIGWTRYLVMAMMLSVMLTPAGRRFIITAMGVAEFCLSVAGPLRLSFLTPPKSPRLCKLKYRKHNCYVRNTVNPKQLLEYRPNDGWEPLCKFLDKDIPVDQTYPHKNKKSSLFTSGEFSRHPSMRSLLIQCLVVFVVLAVLTCYFAYALLSYLILVVF